jgi:hypothetical protein
MPAWSSAILRPVQRWRGAFFPEYAAFVWRAAEARYPNNFLREANCGA